MSQSKVFKNNLSYVLKKLLLIRMWPRSMCNICWPHMKIVRNKFTIAWKNIATCVNRIWAVKLGCSTHFCKTYRRRHSGADDSFLIQNLCFLKMEKLKYILFNTLQTVCWLYSVKDLLYLIRTYQLQNSKCFALSTGFLRPASCLVTWKESL